MTYNMAYLVYHTLSAPAATLRTKIVHHLEKLPEVLCSYSEFNNSFHYHQTRLVNVVHCAYISSTYYSLSQNSNLWLAITLAHVNGF